MKLPSIVTPSSQVDTSLPIYIYENYERFVEFMQTTAESEERLGFGQDLLQHLLRYRNFDTYKNPIVQFNYLSNPYDEVSESLAAEAKVIATGADVAIYGRQDTGDDIFILAESEDRILKLNDTFGFPDENGVLLIDNEIILYRKKEGNYLFDLKRGASGTYILPTFTTGGEYAVTEPATHLAGTKVYNLSVLFMVGMLENIHNSFTPDITSERVAPQINRSILLSKIADFYRSKGSKLGIKAIFKFLFAQNDVEVEYPGDRMIVPSKSTWNESDLLRVVQVPDTFCVPTEDNETPAKLINSEITLRSYLDEKIYARATVDYISSYPYEDEVQYEMFVQSDSIKGNIVANPNTLLTRDLNKYGTINDLRDVTTITVESTLGFPDQGIVFIDDEAILYRKKTFNQFLDCTRGYIGVTNRHSMGTKVFGPYYLEGKYIEDGEEKVSRSFPLGLVSSVDVIDPGVLHTVDDEVYVNGPGRIDPREPIMESFIENYDEQLAEQVKIVLGQSYVGNYTAGVSGVYFDKRHVFAVSSNLPYYMFGPFGPNPEWSNYLNGYNQIHVIPRREEIQPNTMFKYKGHNRIGTFVDGVSAFSNVSPERMLTGKVAEYKIVDVGHGYINPTLVNVDREVEANITVKDGKIHSIEETDPIDYGIDPLSRISSGEDAKIQLKFDMYGRVIEAVITEPGRFYKDVPYISVVDATNRGKGALLSCTTNENNELESVEIVYPGIDYNPPTTQAEVIPIGADAILQAIVQYYEYDRVYEIENTANMAFDSGNGFTFEEYTKNRTAFGYLGDPLDVRDRLDDDGTKHSPLIGWAYDGNPIYGPYGYTNRTDDDEGIIQYFSGYVLRKDRSEIIAGGGDDVGTQPPRESVYPMGTFVQDYEHNIDEAVLRRKLLNSEVPERLLEQGGKNLALKHAELETFQILDEFNGMVCNTPEFPKELYPGGVFCYFIGVDVDGSMQFPYIIGPTFKNRPISQNILVNTTEQLQPIVMSPDLTFDPNLWYDDTKLEFDFKLVERFRNPYLRDNRDQVLLSVGEIFKGGISEVLIEQPAPETTEVMDLMYFDSTGTKGTGAQARVSHVQGSPVNFAFGRDIKTCVVSHVQRIDLTWTTPLVNYLFVIDQLVTTSSGAEGYVVNFNYEKQYVDIHVRTPNLIQEGDVMYDVRGLVVNVGALDDPGVAPLDDGSEYFVYHLTTEDGLIIMDASDIESISTERIELAAKPKKRQTRIYASFCEPRDDENQIGDLWWSHKNGRLYVWYDDGDSMQWVCTQPLGMIPLNGASDFGIGTTAETQQYFNHYASDNTITISRKAPGSRADGSRNLYGDLWWSSHTGILYIWNDGLCGNCGSFRLTEAETVGEWVCADPNAKVPTVGASDKSQFYRTTRMLKTFPINSIVSNYPPDAGEGTLWWCPGTAKHYIKFKDQWVINNPVGMVPNKYAYDEIIVGGGGQAGGAGPIIPLPETEIVEGMSELWFRDLKYFVPQDDISFRIGAPVTGMKEEDAKLDAILRFGPPDKGRVIRGENPIPIPDGAPTHDETRSLYIINTKTPHNLRPGDYIKIENSLYEEVNDTHVIINAGYVDPARGTAIVRNGEVVEVIINYPGKYYTENFYVYFVGGGGVGALAFAEVDDLKDGGGVNTITILDGGFNYTSSPDVIFGTELTNKVMILYMSETYGPDPYITYSTPTLGIQGDPAYFLVTSPGKGYEELPICVGLYKKYSDRAETKISMNGGKITDVDVMTGGRRYDSPMGVIEDLANSGSGAEVEVNSQGGIIQSIDVISGGDDYIEPIITLVESRGKFYSLTEDIGKVKSIRILNPGRDISPDPSLKPELQLTTQIVITNASGSILPGQELYQGTPTNKQVTAIVDYFEVEDNTTVISTEDTSEAIVNTNKDPDFDESGIEVGQTAVYNNPRQTVQLIRVEGNLKAGEMIYGPDGQALVMLEGQSDCRVVIDGVSAPEGKFIDDTSKVSERYPVIQDSYYYQWFSYVIQSELQQVQYKNFISDIVHPAGFIMFSDVTISDTLKSNVSVDEVVFTSLQTPINN